MKSVTCRPTLVVWLSDPLVPVIVSCEVATGVFDAVLTVRVELLVVVGLGLKLPVAPVGSPLTLNVTASAKPPVRLIVTV